MPSKNETDEARKLRIGSGGGSVEDIPWLLAQVETLQQQYQVLRSAVTADTTLPPAAVVLIAQANAQDSELVETLTAQRAEAEGASILNRAALRAALTKNAELLLDWREHDQILQEIAGLVNDEHVTDAAGVLREVKLAFAEREREIATLKAERDGAQTAAAQWRDQLAAAKAERETLQQERDEALALLRKRDDSGV